MIYCKNSSCVYMQEGKCKLSEIKKTECLSINE